MGLKSNHLAVDHSQDINGAADSVLLIYCIVSSGTQKEDSRKRYRFISASLVMVCGAFSSRDFEVWRKFWKTWVDVLLS